MMIREEGTEPEMLFVITMRCADLARPVAGATVSACHICEAPVWISPSTLSAVPGPPLLTCIPCAKPLLAKDAREPEPLTDDQRLEIARATGLYGDALDRAIDWVIDRLRKP